MSPKFLGLAFGAAALASVTSASAEQLNVADTRNFIAGKQFNYQCFDGTSGRGRINADGSVHGYISIGGTQPPRFVVLPAGTVRVKGDRYCASVPGIPFEPCFNVNRTSSVSFRGLVSGIGFAYCDFTGRTEHADIARPPLRLRNVRSPSASASVFADQ